MEEEIFLRDEEVIFEPNDVLQKQNTGEVQGDAFLRQEKQPDLQKMLTQAHQGSSKDLLSRTSTHEIMGLQINFGKGRQQTNVGSNGSEPGPVTPSLPARMPNAESNEGLGFSNVAEPYIMAD